MTLPLDPEALRIHYRSFLRPGRILLTGHSHQAWPDVAREAQLQAFDDAARHVDDKWEAAFDAAHAVRASVAEDAHARPDQVALGANTHELVTRFLSALPLTRKRHLVTTAGEFHTLYRQLRRLSEEGIRVDFVAPTPVETLSERIAALVHEETAAVLVSTVLFETSTRVPHLKSLAEHCHAKGAELLLDVYHQFRVAPLGLQALGAVWVVGGGYKYAEWGEGNCFMVVPEGCELRPVVTGWFADFGTLSAPREDVPVTYGKTLAERFAGATYDPTSHYRARAVIEFFKAHKMTPWRLEATYAKQTQRIVNVLSAKGFDLASSKHASHRGGFVSVRVGDAAKVVSDLARLDVRVDARGSFVRLGPAPYLTDEEIDHGLNAFVKVAGR